MSGFKINDSVQVKTVDEDNKFLITIGGEHYSGKKGSAFIIQEHMSQDYITVDFGNGDLYCFDSDDLIKL